MWKLIKIYCEVLRVKTRKKGFRKSLPGTVCRAESHDIFFSRLLYCLPNPKKLFTLFPEDWTLPLPPKPHSLAKVISGYYTTPLIFALTSYDVGNGPPCIVRSYTAFSFLRMKLFAMPVITVCVLQPTL